jgi:hypothetical protein
VADSLYDRTPTYAGVRIERRFGDPVFYFGPARLPGVAAMWTLITLVACGGTTALYMKGVSPIIVLFPGLLSLVFIYSSLHLWLFISTLRVEPGSLILRKGILGLGLPKRIPLDDIRTVKAERTGNRGESKESVYYKLVLVMKEKKRLIMAHYIKEKDHAHWLTEKIRQAIDRGG